LNIFSRQRSTWANERPERVDDALAAIILPGESPELAASDLQEAALPLLPEAPFAKAFKKEYINLIATCFEFIH